MKSTLAEVVVREQLRDLGFSPAKIDAAIAREFGIPKNILDQPPEAARSATEAHVNYVQIIGPPLRFPIRLVLPWSTLVSDNQRERPIVRRLKSGQMKPAKALTAEYKAARAKIQKIAVASMTVEGKTFTPLTGDLALVARVYVPSGRRTDIVNFAKGVHDALSKIVYADDLQLRDVRWLYAGQDTDAPRAEIEVRPL